MLYKFQSFNDSNTSALEKNSAWFSKPKAFNDPFEGIYIDDTQEMSDIEFISFCRDNQANHIFINMFNISCSMDDWLSKIYVNGQAAQFKMEFKKRSSHSLKMQQEYFYNSGVCCFIMGDDNKPINNTLMWGHYGDGLKGYALGISSLPQNVFKEKIISIPVEYKQTPPKINATELTRKLINKKTIDECEHCDIEVLLKIMNTKHERWEYENELRFISHDYGNRLVAYNENAINSVFIGERMPSLQKSELIRIAKKNYIDNIYEAYVNKNSYSVSVRPLVML